MLVVETIAKIRRAYFSQGKEIKEICRELRISRKVVRKVIRTGATEFRYERSRQPMPRLGPWREQLEALADRWEAELPRLVLRHDGECVVGRRRAAPRPRVARRRRLLGSPLYSLLWRERGTPQGGVIKPSLLANLFLHYAFDIWMRRRAANHKHWRNKRAVGFLTPLGIAMAWWIKSDV
jgi:hypothetical protein